ncbi:MAG: CD1871A family CXXC motif-containing protein [Eubacteriales bacterium]|nr:CD1871A family CXXC motif-containing protein [Eubacteriales bacterium]
MSALRSRMAGLLLAAAGAGMMVYGILRGEAAVVFAKAVRICLECIGVG